MDFRQLEYVISIQEEGTLLAAAEKLYLSSSALSQHVNHLETELHTKLFIRDKKRWRLTSAGEIYIDMAKNILKIQKTAYRKISNLSEGTTGNIVVGITPGAGAFVFSNIFKQFKEEYPEIKVKLVEKSGKELIEQLLLDKIDLAFLTSGITHPDVVTKQLLREKLVLAVPYGHPLASGKNSADGKWKCIDLKNLEEEPLLLLDKNTTFRFHIDQLFREIGFFPKVLLEVSSLATLSDLAIRGAGITFLPLTYAKRRGEYVCFETNPGIQWEIVAAYRKNVQITKVGEYLIHLSEEYMGSLFQQKV